LLKVRRSSSLQEAEWEASEPLPPVALGLIPLIVGWQSVEVSEKYLGFASTPFWITPYFAWSCLFAILGVTAVRRIGPHPNLKYALRRVLQLLVPAWLSVILALLIIGPLATTQTLGEFYSELGTWSYLLNMIGWPVLSMPAVFEFMNYRSVVNPVMVFVPAGLATVAMAELVAIFPRGAKFLCLLVAAGLLTVLAFGMLGTAEPLQLSLAAGTAGIIGVTGMRLPRRGRSLALALLCGLAAVAIVGSRRPELQTLGSAAQVPLSVALANLGRQVRMPRVIGNVAQIIAPWPALLIAFPVQQLVSSWPPASANPIINLLVATPLIMALAAAMTRLVRMEAFGGAGRTPGGELSYHSLADLRHVLRRPNRNLLALAAVTLAVVALFSAVLVITIFSMQRMPWEN
jgi:hypothetical protein